MGRNTRSQLGNLPPTSHEAGQLRWQTPRPPTWDARTIRKGNDVPGTSVHACAPRPALRPSGNDILVRRHDTPRLRHDASSPARIDRAACPLTCTRPPQAEPHTDTPVMSRIYPELEPRRQERVNTTDPP